MKELKEEAAANDRAKRIRASAGIRKKRGKGNGRSRKSSKILCSHIQRLIGTERSLVAHDKYQIKLQFKNGDIAWVESSEIDHNSKKGKIFNEFAKRLSNDQWKTWAQYEDALRVDPKLQAGLHIEWKFSKDGSSETDFFPIVYRYKSGLEPGWLADVCWDKSYDSLGPGFTVCQRISSVLFRFKPCTSFLVL